MNGAQFQRRTFKVAAAGENTDKEALSAVCAQSGHVPTGPAKRRVCFRCGEWIRTPSLEEISKLMAAKG